MKKKLTALPLLKPKNNYRKYWFALGREPLLAAAEIEAVLDLGEEGREKREEEKENILKINTDINAVKLINELGGTVKIGVEMGENLNKEELIKKIIDELKTINGKINFGISLYNDEKYQIPDIRNFGLLIKKQLKMANLSVRYVPNKEPVLSSATVFHNKLTDRGREFLITTNKEKINNFNLAKTLAVQPFEQFSQRDFGRPGRDDKSGMLPPKLAMMMINLSKTTTNNILLDPFCGSGTILTEAILLGYNKLIGSDNSEKAITDTKKNVQWIISNNQCQTPDVEYYTTDIKEISKKIKPSSVDAVITEPYLGRPLTGKENKEQLEQQITALTQLYLEAFKQFKKIIKPKGKIIFIIPRFKFKNEWLTFNIELEIKKLGFLSQPFLNSHKYLAYFRHNQLVGREIRQFTSIT